MRGKKRPIPHGIGRDPKLHDHSLIASAGVLFFLPPLRGFAATGFTGANWDMVMTTTGAAAGGCGVTSSAAGGTATGL